MTDQVQVPSKVRKPRVSKKTIVQQQQNPIQEESKQEQSTLISNNSIQEQKQQVILGIDPAFKKNGISILCSNTVSFKPEGKLIQSEIEGYLSNNCQKLISSIFMQYDVQYVVIELQLGQFSCSAVQLLFVSCLPQDVKYTIQHSKLKLKFPQVKTLMSQNPDSNKYNQNKMMGQQLCKLLYPELEDTITRDECDSILTARYAYEHISEIKWITKQELKLQC